MCTTRLYTHNSTVKFLNQLKTPYPKKNWSSMMLFNNAKCTTLTPDYVNSATGLELHQYKWLENEELIGKIDEEWNWLVGEYEYNSNAKLVHYTEDFIEHYFKNYKNCDYLINGLTHLKKQQERICNG